MAMSVKLPSNHYLSQESYSTKLLQLAHVPLEIQGIELLTPHTLFQILISFEKNHNFDFKNTIKYLKSTILHFQWMFS